MFAALPRVEAFHDRSPMTTTEHVGGFVVRPALPAEYAAAGQACADGYGSDGLLTLADGTTDNSYRDKLLDAASRAAEAELLVGVAADTVLGTVTWCPLGSPWRQVARGDHQGEFRMLAVAPAGRRRGVAHALVAACLQRARSAGMTEVVLSSLPQMTPAHALYGAYGFTRVPELDFTPMAQVHLWGFRLLLGDPEGG